MVTPLYRCIGRGNCGSVWALEGSQQSVYKREDGNYGRSVLNDRAMHKRVLDGAGGVAAVQVPCSYGIIEASDEWWQGSTGLSRFPSGFESCRAYHIERIPAMPQHVRQMLIDRYCPEDLRAFVSTNRDDEDCLVRVYLGRRRIPRQTRFQRFGLRNYPLHVDQMEELGLDTHAMARTLADALAHCLWRACVDANDIEFVLAPSKDTHGLELTLFKAFGAEYPVWMLDYDCCQVMDQNKAGVEQAVKAFYRNDPYYPRPYAHGYTDGDNLLWRTFRMRFLETSHEMLKERLGDGAAEANMNMMDGTDEDPTRLATLFVEKVEEEGRVRRARESKYAGGSSSLEGFQAE